MSQIQPYPLEVTRALVERARTSRFSFGEDTAIVAVQHMLRQTIDLFRAVAGMGVNLKNIFALGKVYSNSPPVMRALKEMGVTVIDTTSPKPGEFHSYFQRDVQRLWEVAAETLAQRRIKRIIVLDDGGVCIANVPANVLGRYALCGVEQTSSGMSVLEKHPPPFAVISWARAAVKLEIGGPVFAHSFVDKLNTKFVHGRLLREERIGVIGYGSIGRGVANLTARQANEVCFYDPDPDLQIPSSVPEAIARVDSLEELMRNCDYVFGCSGRNPFEDKWPLKHKPGAKLFSVSGGDQEFGPIINDLKNKPTFKVKPNNWNIVSDHGPCGPIRIAYHGYPYNFVSRAPDVIPKRIVQLETGGLLAGLIQARLVLDLYEKGKQEHTGIHRVSPRAQRFVYDRWLSVMRSQKINLTSVYGHDPETLAAAQHESWFIENTQPGTRRHTEDLMSRIVLRPIHSRLERKPKPDLRALRAF